MVESWILVISIVAGVGIPRGISNNQGLIWKLAFWINKGESSST